MIYLILFVILGAETIVAALIFYRQDIRIKKLEKNIDILVRAVATHENFIDSLKQEMKKLEVRRRR